MNSQRKNQIRALAEELLNRVKNRSFPVDVIEIIKKDVSITLVQDQVFDGPHMDGFSVIRNGKKIIALNPSGKDHPYRYRFTAAHELGHIALNHDQRANLSKRGQDFVFFRYNSQCEKSELEAEANYFAACMLMPEDAVINKIGNKSCVNEQAIFDMAVYFGVSNLAMTVRLASLGLI